jgi:hypothetical protein
MQDVDFKDISTKVEVVKIGMRHTKDGHIFSMAINPDDTPADFMRDPVGQRYVAVFVRLNDQDEPVASKENEEGKYAVRIAGTLCSDDNFQQWLAINGDIDDATEAAASVWLRKHLNVVSRKELKDNAQARQKLMDVRAEFIEYMRTGR